jgi:hypothetical protein
MSLVFPYTRLTSAQPIISLGGRLDRPYALVGATLVGPTGTHFDRCLLDSGADDTVFPDQAAVNCGIDLTNAPQILLSGVGGGTALVRYAQVAIRITDGIERREWTAWVGFTSAPMKRPLLGFAGFLQFFTAIFYGDLEKVELAVNSYYRGT